MFALVIDAHISFPHLFLRSVNKVYRSSSTAHALFHPVFIHQILLFLDLDDFPASKPVHIVAPIGATFLRQKAAHMRVGSKHPRDEPSGVAPLPPTSTGDTSTKASVDPVAATVVPPPSTSDDFDICRTLETVTTVQEVHCQLLVNLLYEICALRADLKHFRRLPFGIP